MFTPNRLVYLGSAMVTKKPELVTFKDDRYYCDDKAHSAIKELVRYLNNQFITIEKRQNDRRKRYEENELKQALERNRIMCMKIPFKNTGGTSVKYSVWDLYEGYCILQENPNKILYIRNKFYCSKNSEEEIKAVVCFENGGRILAPNHIFYDDWMDYSPEEMIARKRKEFLIARAKYYFDLGKEDKAIRIMKKIEKNIKEFRKTIAIWYARKGDCKNYMLWKVD